MWGDKKKKDNEINAFLGKGAEFTGTLAFKGSIRIDGDFNGEIPEGGTLIIGEGAHIHASISVNSVLIGGDFHGDIHVKEKVEIYSTGRLWGKVKTPILVIEQGGVFEGTSEMDKTDEADRSE